MDIQLRPIILFTFSFCLQQWHTEEKIICFHIYICILYYQHGINIRDRQQYQKQLGRMLWKKIATEKAIQNDVSSNISEGKGQNDLRHSLKGMDLIYKNLPSQNTRNSQLKNDNNKKINKKEAMDAYLEVSQKYNQNIKKQQKNKYLSSQQNYEKTQKNNQNLNLQYRYAMKNVNKYSQQVESKFDHDQEKKQKDPSLNINQQQNIKDAEQKSNNLLKIGHQINNSSPFNSDIKRGESNIYESKPRSSGIQSYLPSSFNVPNQFDSLKLLQSKFKANSLGGSRQKKQIKKNIKTGFDRMNSSELEEQLQDQQFSGSLNENGGIFKYNTKDKVCQQFLDELPIDDFIEQMKEAGIDVADVPDIQSNYNQNSKGSFQIKKPSPKQQFDKDKDTLENYHKLLKQSQNESQNKIQDNRTAQFQSKLKTQKASSQRNSNYLNQISKQEIKQQLARVLHIIKQIHIYRTQILKIYDKIIKQKLVNGSFVAYCSKQLQNIINSIYENKKLTQINQIQENLKFKVLQLQSHILQKQVSLQKLKQINNELKKENQQLTENTFEINQKLAQSELVFQQKMQQYIAQYEGQSQLRLKQQQNKQFTQRQIRRLNQEVQELTRLYETSQQQNRKVLQNQKLTLQIEIQKIARKQAILNQKQTRLQQKIRFLKQEEQMVRQTTIKNSKRQKQLMQMQKILKQKLMKMQELQQQINEGFEQIESGKREMDKAQHKYIQQIKNLKKQKNGFLARIQRLVDQKKELQQQLNNYRNRKSTQRQYNKPTQYSTKKILDNIHKNRQMLTQYERDPFGQDYETQIRDQRRRTYTYDDYNDDDLQYTFMKTQRIPTQNDKKLRTKFHSREQSNEKLLYRKSINTQEAYPTSIYSSPYQNDKRYQQNRYKGITQNYKRDPKFMSQVINASPKSNKFTASGFRFGEYKSLEQNTYNNQQMSPKLRQILIKSKSANKISVSKLDELDNKIQSLRKEIKKEVNAAKKQQ